MDPTDSEHVREFEQSLTRWTDSRFLSRDSLRTMAMFTMYLVNLAEADGWDLRGYSWKRSSYLGCLVVKSIVDGVPSVAFTNAKTPVAGMRIFLRKMEGGFLEWIK
ncbi:unnamed protein product, partial [marine sediment metagenome]